MTGVGSAPSESRTYNSLGQMTALTSGSMQRTYAFSSSSNNGKITSESDPVSGSTTDNELVYPNAAIAINTNAYT